MELGYNVIEGTGEKSSLYPRFVITEVALIGVVFMFYNLYDIYIQIGFYTQLISRISVDLLIAERRNCNLSSIRSRLPKHFFNDSPTRRHIIHA